MERDLLQKALDAIQQVYKGVGTPGDFGYDTREGRALSNLYDVNNEIAAFLASDKVES